MSQRKIFDKWVANALNVPDNPSLIRPPRKSLFSTLLMLWCIFFILILFSFSVFLIVVLPVYAFSLYFFALYTKVWSGYGYSKAVLIAATFIAFVCFAIISGPIRALIFNI